MLTPRTDNFSFKRSNTTPLWQAWLAVPLAAVALARPWKLLSSEASPEAELGEAARTVKADRPAPATTASVVLPATVRPWQTTTMHARVTGYLQGWHHDLGERVKAGRA